MKKNRSSLAEALKSKTEPSIKEASKSTIQEKKLDDEKTSTYKQPPSRRGTKPLTVHVDPAVIKQLKVLGLEKDNSVKNLVIEALNDYFEKNGKSPIA